MRRILVFGAGGQLGQEIVARSGAFPAQIAARSRGETDIADRASVAAALDQIRPDVVVNAGAYTKVDKAESDRDEAHRSNVLGPGIVAEECAQRDVPLIHFSTDYVFDGGKQGAYCEDDPLSPLGVYGATKAEGEDAIRQAAERHIILRTSWVYGVYGANFLKTILRLAKERDELRIVDDQYGCPTSTADLAEAALRLAALPEHRWGTYHFAGSGATTWHGFAREIVDRQAAFTGRRPPVSPITTADYPTPARRPANSELDSDLFHASFGWRALPWQERVREAVQTLCGQFGRSTSP